MNDEIYALLIEAINNELHKTLHGELVVKMMGDTLYISIKPNLGMFFIYTKEQVFDCIINNETAQTIVNDFIEKYKRYIKKQLFKRKVLTNK